MNHFCRIAVAAALLCVPSFLSAQAVKPVKVIPVDDSVWSFNWAAFDQDKIVSVGDYQYTIYWNADASLSVARRNLVTDEVQTVNFPQHILSRSQTDGHRNTVLGTSPGDGRLHMSFDHHNNNLRYTRSRKDFLTSPPLRISADDFETTQLLTADAPQRVTYPRFVNDHAGNLFLMYRSGGSGNGRTIWASYHADTGKWQIVADRLLGLEGLYTPWNNSKSRNAYEHTLLFDRKGRLHLSWTYREDGRSWASNHDLFYAVSPDNGVTWFNNAGDLIADTRKKENIVIDTPGIRVFDIPVYSWLMNTGTMALDSRDQPHLITYHLTERVVPEKLEHGPPAQELAKKAFYHYWRTPDGKWHCSQPITPPDAERASIRRGQTIVDADDTVYFYWSTPNGIRCHAAHAADGWKKWTTFMMSGPDLLGTDASIHDRARLRDQGILSFTANHLGTKGKGFAIVDYRLSDLARAAQGE